MSEVPLYRTVGRFNGPAEGRHLAALILSPTRELALQVDREFFIDNLLVYHPKDLVDRPRAMGV